MSDSVPIVGLDELEKHVNALNDDPETPLNAKLFDDVELQLNGELWISLFIDWTVIQGPL